MGPLEGDDLELNPASRSSDERQVWPPLLFGQCSEANFPQHFEGKGGEVISDPNSPGF